MTTELPEGFADASLKQLLGGLTLGSWWESWCDKHFLYSFTSSFTSMMRRVNHVFRWCYWYHLYHIVYAKRTCYNMNDHTNHSWTISIYVSISPPRQGLSSERDGCTAAFLAAQPGTDGRQEDAERHRKGRNSRDTATRVTYALEWTHVRVL